MGSQRPIPKDGNGGTERDRQGCPSPAGRRWLLRKGEEERRGLAGRALYPDAATVGTHQLTADVQTQPEAADRAEARLLGSIEAGEETGGISRWNTGPWLETAIWTASCSGWTVKRMGDAGVPYLAA